MKDQNISQYHLDLVQEHTKNKGNRDQLHQTLAAAYYNLAVEYEHIQDYELA